MTKGQDPQFEMAHARKSEGIHVIFDQDTMASPLPSRSRSKSSCGSSRSSGSDRRVRGGTTRRRYRSSSTSSNSSRSRSHSRSRSRPRCHRRSSRCRCASHHRSSRVRRHCTPPRRHSRSYSCSPSPDKSSRHRRKGSRSRSGGLRKHRRGTSHVQHKISKSSSRSWRRRSRSPGRSAVSLSADDKKELLRAAKANVTKILGVEQLELPESVKPMLEEQLAETKEATPEASVRPDPVPQKTSSESSEVEPDEDMLSPRMSPKRKLISFSVHNSVAKPTAASLSGAKVTARMDSYESRKPYGHWVTVKKHKASRPRKHTLATSH